MSLPEHVPGRVPDSVGQDALSDAQGTSEPRPQVQPAGSGREPDAVSNRVLTWPNLLSIARLCGVPLFLWLVLGPEKDGLALVVLALSGITDWLDGKLARTLNQSSKLGQILDPVADRCYILAVVIGLAIRGIIPWWLAIGLPLRDVFLFALVPFLRTRG